MIESKNISLERAVLVGIVTKEQDEVKSKEYLDELEFLTFTAGGEVVKRFTQKMEMPNPKTFLGTGKIEEVEHFIKENNIGTAIFDDELSSAQERNISKILNCKVLDRTNLILDIFAQNAHTLEGKAQVELAIPQLSHLVDLLEKLVALYHLDIWLEMLNQIFQLRAVLGLCDDLSNGSIITLQTGIALLIVFVKGCIK